MCNFIGMEYLAALALIKEDVNEISLSDLNNYGINIMKTFEENKVNSVFLFSDKYALDLVRNYSECFELVKNDTVLRRKAPVEVLISKFIAYLSNDTLMALSKVKKCTNQ
ncbi:MAG: hypothetical protein PUJ82_05920 [Spirochaetales bacterium]|nr:hypothetical protein [Spirochaetales bacterium]MDD7610431.1 hypothetical protein [Spirochaetales bacterium]